MKIIQLLSDISMPLSNQESQFVKKYKQIKIDSLNEQEHWVAQNLLRKGIYKLSNDNQLLISNLHEND